jgi:7-alpha-hydroxysteroid dehydrogenase
VVGKVAGRGYLAYGTAKGALIHYTELAAEDLAPKIRMNAIAVGSTATSALDIVMSNDEMRTGIENATPLRRLGTTDDIAAAVVYLASPAGSYLTGAVLDVHGGLQQPNMRLPLPDL